MPAELFSLFYQFADVFTFLILSAAGLAVVFGMMGVINMAHGEFIMCGAYVPVGLVRIGLPLASAGLVRVQSGVPVLAFSLAIHPPGGGGGAGGCGLGEGGGGPDAGVFDTAKKRLPMPCECPRLSVTCHAIVWRPSGSLVESNAK